MVWGIYIAIYLFAAGAGAGAFLAGVAAKLWGGKSFRPLAQSGILLGGPLVGAGMPFLILDLGIGKREPWRLFFLFFGNSGSIMTLGAWIISIFVTVALAVAFLEIDIPVPWASAAKYIALGKARLLPHQSRLTVLAVITAFATAIYTGVLIGVIIAAPIWNSTILPVLFLTSAMSTGLAAAVVGALALNWKDRHAVEAKFPLLGQVHSAFIVLELALIFCWLYLGAVNSLSMARSVGMLTIGELAAFFWLGVILVGLVAPLAAYAYEAARHRPIFPYATLASDLGVLVGGFVLRYLVLAARVPIVLS